MDDFNLTSLAYLSKHIVLVERFADGTGGTACRVKKVYKGTLLPGFELPLPDLRSYSFADELAKWDAEMVLFLDSSREIVSSGVKLLSAGRVHRSIQAGNPGLYKAYPERREGDAVEEDPTVDPDADVRLPELEQDLRRALARVVKLETAKQARDSRALLELLGPVKEWPVLGRMHDWGGMFTEAFLPAVLQALFPLANEELVLEAAARCRWVEYRALEWPVEDKRLLSAATDRAAPIHRRIAALRLLFITDSAARTKTEINGRLASLLTEPAPEIRRAAASYLGKILESSPRIPSEASAPLVEALWAASREEKDPLVRTAIFAAFNDDLASREAAARQGGEIILEGCVRDNTAYYVYLFADGWDRAAKETLVVVAPVAGGPERRQTLGGRGIPAGASGPQAPATLRRRRELERRETFAGQRTKRLVSKSFELHSTLAPGLYRLWLEGQYGSLTVKSTVTEVEVLDNIVAPNPTSSRKP